MIAENSILRNLPSALNRKQALLFDGIRHAAEISMLAHDRLNQTLTEIALRDLDKLELPERFTSAFLDAWAFVDAVDRFRSIWLLLGRSGSNDEPSEPTFAEITQPVRDLRNVADHLATRADYVVGPANPPRPA